MAGELGWSPGELRERIQTHGHKIESCWAAFRSQSASDFLNERFSDLAEIPEVPYNRDL